MKKNQIFFSLLICILLMSFESAEAQTTREKKEKYDLQKLSQTTKTKKETKQTYQLAEEIDEDFGPKLKWGMTLEMVKRSHSNYKEGSVPKTDEDDPGFSYRVNKVFYYNDQPYYIELIFYNGKLLMYQVKFINCDSKHRFITNDGFSMSQDCLTLWKSIYAGLTKKYGKPTLIKDETPAATEHLVWYSTTTSFSLDNKELGFIFFYISNKNIK